MVVQHNLTAMNSNRMLGITTKSQSKSTEKLSSGYKINRAADDAAGLSISEKMRKQIRGLTQASLNAQDGISAVQTAEGALTEVHDMLQRMNELAVKAANGTNSSDDRSYIQSEVDQLISEIDRVAQTTKFNETYLLKGDDATATTTTVTNTTTTPATDDKKSTVVYKDGKGEDGTISLASGAAASIKWYKAGSTTAMDEDEILASVEAKKDGTIVFKAGVQVYTTAAAAAGSEFGVQVSTALVKAPSSSSFTISSTKLASSADGKTKIEADKLADYFTPEGELDATKKVYAQASDGTWKEVGNDQISLFVDVTAGERGTPEQTETTTSTVTTAGAVNLSLHVGADGNDDNKIELKIAAMTAAGIGVSGLDVSTETNATNAIETLKSAIQAVSEQRSTLGAIQNRLEHTINNLDNVVENTTSAESQIRDTDMATEMVKYSNNNILAQAGQAMLAQSNQSNQGVLSLLG